MSNLYKIKSVIFGHAVADALGVPVEFASREELEDSPVTDMEGYGTYPYPAGCWSDDTGMTLAALDSLKDGKIDYREIMENFIKWLMQDKYTPTGRTFDAGMTCINAIEKYAKEKTLECGCTGERSNGNGSLMRILPFVLFCEYNNCQDDWVKIIHTASGLTHAHDRSKIGCGIYAFVLRELLKNPDISSVYEGLDKAYRYYLGQEELEHYKRIFDKDFEKIKRKEIKSSGYVVDTLEAAIWCLLNTESYEECVLEAVNLGEDTDTVGAVAGGLAGALYGYDEIPYTWLNVLKRKELIEDMCEKASENWG